MRPISGTRSQLNRQAERRMGSASAEYIAAIAPAFLRELPGEILVYDADHPAWIEAVRKHRGDDAVRMILERQNTPVREITISKPIPRKEWPTWALVLADNASDDDTGIGDTVVRTIGEPASTAFKFWYEKLFGGTCGCEQRQAEWNLLYPYGRRA